MKILISNTNEQSIHIILIFIALRTRAKIMKSFFYISSSTVTGRLPFLSVYFLPKVCPLQNIQIKCVKLL